MNWASRTSTCTVSALPGLWAEPFNALTTSPSPSPPILWRWAGRNAVRLSSLDRPDRRGWALARVFHQATRGTAILDISSSIAISWRPITSFRCARRPRAAPLPPGPAWHLPRSPAAFRRRHPAAAAPPPNGPRSTRRPRAKPRRPARPGSGHGAGRRPLASTMALPRGEPPPTWAVDQLVRRVADGTQTWLAHLRPWRCSTVAWWLGCFAAPATAASVERKRAPESADAAHRGGIAPCSAPCLSVQNSAVIGSLSVMRLPNTSGAGLVQRQVDDLQELPRPTRGPRFEAAGEEYLRFRSRSRCTGCITPR